jgi:ESCRT-I complex subunit TSG101
MTGTVTAEHLTASIRSAVEDKVRRGLREQVEEKSAEMQVLKRTGEELGQGQSRLKELVERMKREEEELDRDTAILEQKKTELETLQERAAEQEPLNPDDAVEAGAPLFRQLTNAYSEENAVEDALYFLGRALGEGALECDGYLKQVRVLSRRQFLLRETMNRCRRKAGLDL